MNIQIIEQIMQFIKIQQQSKIRSFEKFRERFLLLKHGPKHVVSLEKSSYPNYDSS